MQLGVLEYLISVNNKDLDKGLKNSENKFKKSADSISKWAVAKGQIIAKFAEKAITTVSNAGMSIIKSAVNATADYEQLVGGVETLFGDAAVQVQKFAEQAYKTAGISANEYMETVTSFSASLLQSLSGDTDKAADYADMAIKDMADNANKMGSTMESIQNAYQGFAKQNYTMLDNLKLGYGGTRTEMQRLLKDAGKLVNRQFDIKKLSDVYEAIHIIQQEMKITGTTQKEAEFTITGSINSAKAAWKDLLTAMGTGKDVKGATKRFAESVKKVAKNLVPVVKEVFKNLVVSIKDIIPEFTSLVGDIWNDLKQSLPEDSFLRKAMDAVQGLISLLGDLAMDWDGTVEKLKQSDSPVLQQVGFYLGIVSAVASWLLKLITDFPSAIQELKDSDSPILQAIGGALEWIQGLFIWIENNQQLVVDAITAILAAFAVGKIISIVASMSPITLILGAIAAAATLIITNWEPIQKFFENLWGAITAAVSIAWGSITKWWTNIKTKFSTAWNTISEWFQTNVWDKVSSGAEAAWSLVQSAIQPVLDVINDVIEGVQSVINWFGELMGFDGKSLSSTTSSHTHTNYVYTIEAGKPADKGKVEAWQNDVNGTNNKSTDFFGTATDTLKDWVTPKAKGDFNVAHDMIAQLHQGEMVLTKSQARRYREGEDADYMVIGSMIGSAIENAMSRVYVMMSGEKVGDLTTRRVKKNMNANSYSKLRALGG